MNDNDFNRLRVTLCGGDEASEQRYYVYGLFEKGKPYPFYIGKGQNARVFQHEAEYQEIYDSIKDEPDFESRWAKLSEKLKKIEKAKEIEKVIIKWGLTNEEAYMCESALINLYQYMVYQYKAESEAGKKLQLEELTNALNGHASELEKANKAGKTKARTVKDFVVECALDKLDISTGERGKSPIDALVIFIRINKLYQSGMSDEELREITRGCWNISDLIYNYIKHSASTAPVYIAGIYQQVVKCVYKVENIYGKRDFDDPDQVSSLTKAYMADENRKETLALELLEFQSKDLKDFIEKIQKYKEEHPNFNFPFGKECDGDCVKCCHREDSCALKEYCKKDGTLIKQFEKWKCRKFFTVSDDVPTDLRTNLMDHMIACKNDPTFLSSAQNSFTMNFDIKAGEIQFRDQIYFLRKHIHKKLSGTKKSYDDISKFLDLLIDEKYLIGDPEDGKDFTLRGCLSDEEKKNAETKPDRYYKIDDSLTAEEFDKQFKETFPEAASKESKRSKKDKNYNYSV